jgi:hypothetical protein
MAVVIIVMVNFIIVECVHLEINQQVFNRQITQEEIQVKGGSVQKVLVQDIKSLGTRISQRPNWNLENYQNNKYTKRSFNGNISQFVNNQNNLSSEDFSSEFFNKSDYNKKNKK